MKHFILAFILAGAMVCAGQSAPAADKIRISVTNFNMAFLPAGRLSREASSKRRAWRRKSFG
jgi:hypothetical protein